MNVILWIVQIALALLSLAGGAYKIFSFAELAKMPATAALPRAAWAALGAFEIVCGLLLVIPAALKWKPRLTPLAAIALAIESLALAVVYSRYSTELTATNPMPWVLFMALMAAFVAWGHRKSR